MDNPNEKLLIDVEKVLASKNKKLAKRVPKFLYNLLKRIIHQDEINEILLKYGHLEGVDFINKVYEHFNFKITVHGEENLAPDSRYIFVSNHPLGGLDGIILMHFIASKFGDVKAISNDLLTNVKPLKPLFIPVNKYGNMSHEYAENLINAYKSETPILNFPAGLCSRKIKGEVKDLPWRKSFIKRAIDSQRDIVPVYFDGKNSNFFYNFANLRKFLGIKFNFELLLLPDEMFKQLNNSFDIYIGEPIKYESITKEHTYAEWTEIIREKAYNGRYNKTN